MNEMHAIIVNSAR